MVVECFDQIMGVAEDRKIGEYQALNTSEIRVYISQLVKLLEIVHEATKILEADNY